MTTRQKTIEFLTQTDPTNLASATNRDKTVTVYIPETVVAFQSVMLECTYVSNATTAGNLTAQTIGLQIGAAAMNTASLGSNQANSGERYGNILARDMTSEFTTNWSGTSQTVTCRVSITTTATANHGFRIRITYDYDDTASTHIKTVRIPIESTRATLTTSAQTLGGATAIPALGNGYFPEASVVIRNAVVELWGTELSSAAVATLTLNYNGDTNVDSWLSTNTTINSDCLVHAQYDISAKALTSAVAMNATSLTTTGRFGNLGGWITVTYEYAPGSSSTIFNSLIMGAFNTSGWAGGTTSGDTDAWDRTIYIDEPGTITLKESAITLACTDSGTLTLNVLVGSQTNTAYTLTIGGATCTCYFVTHRIDAGGAKGTAGITLARGPNSYLAKVYSSTSNAGWGLSGCLILNYTSDKSSQGVGAHAQSRYHHIANTNATTAIVVQTSAAAPTIPEADYWLVSACIEARLSTLGGATGSMAINAELGAGEGAGSGWQDLYAGQFRSSAEVRQSMVWAASRSSWKRHPRDTDTNRMDIETSRAWRIDSQPATQFALGIWYTYRSITFAFGGTVSGSGGGTVNLKLFKYGTTDVELLDATTRSGNGAYSFTWYDDVDTVYTEAYEDGTHIGRSDNGNAA